MAKVCAMRWTVVSLIWSFLLGCRAASIPSQSTSGGISTASSAANQVAGIPLNISTFPVAPIPGGFSVIQTLNRRKRIPVVPYYAGIIGAIVDVAEKPYLLSTNGYFGDASQGAFRVAALAQIFPRLNNAHVLWAARTVTENLWLDDTYFEFTGKVMIDKHQVGDVSYQRDRPPTLGSAQTADSSLAATNDTAVSDLAQKINNIAISSLEEREYFWKDVDIPGGARVEFIPMFIAVIRAMIDLAVEPSRTICNRYSNEGDGPYRTGISIELDTQPDAPHGITHQYARYALSKHALDSMQQRKSVEAELQWFDRPNRPMRRIATMRITNHAARPRPSPSPSPSPSVAVT